MIMDSVSFFLSVCLSVTRLASYYPVLLYIRVSDYLFYLPLSASVYNYIDRSILDFVLNQYLKFNIFANPTDSFLLFLSVLKFVTSFYSYVY